jgi:hypothetical protein
METQGEFEAAICQGIKRFEEEYMGRRLKDIRAHLIDDRTEREMKFMNFFVFLIVNYYSSSLAWRSYKGRP